MGRKAGAIGFALYLDLLEELEPVRDGFDVDVLVLYDAESGIERVVETVKVLSAAGKCVSAQKAIPPKLRYREVCDLRKGANK